MAATIVNLFGFEGPNITGPQPAVLLRVAATEDWSRRLGAALKDAAQAVGMVIGYLDVAAAATPGAVLTSASFATPTPALGVELARYVVDGLNAAERGDDDWDPDEPLWHLQRKRRAEALPVAALQIIAEAGRRGVPSFVRADGGLQLGFGRRGMVVDLAPLRQATVAAPFAAGPAGAIPWEQLGEIPLIVVSGGGQGPVARALGGRADAGFDDLRALLADPGAAAVLAGLEPGDLARRGFAADRCRACAVVGLPETPAGAFTDREELARALAVPMLVVAPGGVAVLDADTPELAELAEFAPCPVVLFARAEQEAIARHRAAGGAAIFGRGGRLLAAVGADEQALGATPAGEGALAAAAIHWALAAGGLPPVNPAATP